MSEPPELAAALGREGKTARAAPIADLSRTDTERLAALDEAGRHAVGADLRTLFARMNNSDNGALVAPSEYLEVVIIKR